MALLKLVDSELVPEDQAREDQIKELFFVVNNPLRPEHERRAAFRQASILIAQRPDYVVKKMEREQGLYGKTD